MEEKEAIDSALAAAAETSGERAAETFSLLANETRLAILLALWEAYEPYASENAVSFSALRHRVGIRQGAQFNYHLDHLVGRFVEKTEDGYALRRAGHELVRTVVAGTGIEDASQDPVEISIDCPSCGAPTAVTYRDEWLYIVCTDCDGTFQGDDRPDGMLSGTEFDPAGLTDRPPEMMWRAGWFTGKTHIQLAVEGVCDACSGPITQSLDVCADHDAEGVCDRCGRQFAVQAQFRCPVCKNHHEAPPRTVVLHHPAVIAFYYERGVNVQYDDGSFESLRRRGELISDHEQELVSEEPPRVRVTIRYEGDELSLLLDETLDVVEIERSD